MFISKIGGDSNISDASKFESCIGLNKSEMSHLIVKI